MYENKHHSDVVCRVDGKEFAAHKWVLSLHSEVFKKMFESNMHESVSGEIEITDCDAEVFELFLRYLYTGECGEDILANHCCAMLTVSTKYLVDNLGKLCVAFIMRNEDAQKAVDYIMIADKLGLINMKKSVTAFILSNMNEVLASTDIIDRAPALLREIAEKGPKRRKIQ